MTGPGGDATRTDVKMPRSRRELGLRSQLLLGLAVVSLFAVFSMGALALWASGRDLQAGREDTARAVSAATAAAVAAVIDGRVPLDDPRNVAAMYPILHQLTEKSGLVDVSVIDLARKVALSRPPRWPQDEDPPVAQAALAGVPAVLNYRQRPVDGETELLGYAPIILQQDRVLGAVRVVLAAPAPIPSFIRSSGPVLLGLALGDAVLLVALGYMLLTLMVVKPLRAVEQATAAVSAGELDLQVKADGPREIAALADAFNQMTTSLASQREQLIRTEKLASVGQLAAGVAHEIGNPLAAILGYADILKTDAQDGGGHLDPTERRDITNRVKAETQRIHRIIQDLLEYSRPGPQDAQPTDPVSVLQDAAELLAPQARFRDVKVKLDGDVPPQDWPLVMASAGRLKQVFVNLLFNAADAMDGQGQIAVGCTADESVVHLTFADQGPGVPRDLRLKIFDPFFTTKDVGRGTGLGLAICRSIIETDGGKLELRDTSEGQSGARFVVSLPRVRSSTAL